jgi:hypothetical protein
MPHDGTGYRAQNADGRSGDVQLVELRRQVDDGSGDVVAVVGPLEDAEADAYAAQLRHLVELHPGLSFTVAITPVESASGAAAEPPATPAELLHAVLSKDAGPGNGEHDLPDPRS